MELKEQKENQYIKELSSVESYLLRIIKRYFDIEEVNNAASINSIITEAIARYKSTIDYEMAAVKSINNQVGIINIDINTLKGEILFEKLTAFNKNFGTAEDTICEGNDQRLSDDRIPVDHHHKLSDINILQDQLDSLIRNMVLYSNHLHLNMALLNKLKYTGTNASIDLAELYDLNPIITNLLHTLSVENSKLDEAFDSRKTTLDDSLKQVDFIIKRLQKYIDDSDTLLKDEIKKYIDDSIKEKIEAIKELINTYADKTFSNLMIDTLNQSKFLADKKEIELSELLNIKTTNCPMETSSYGLLYDTVNTYTGTQKDALWTVNTSDINCVLNATEYEILLSENQYKYYTNDVTLKSTSTGMGTLCVVLAADKNYMTDGHLYNLSLYITPGTSLSHKFCVLCGFQNTITAEIAYDDTFNCTDGWDTNPNGIHLKIERKDNMIYIYRSEMNDTVLSLTPCITIDLNYEGYTDIFNGIHQCGFGCFNQAATFITNSFTAVSEVITGQNIYKEENIDTSVLSTNYLIDTIEIEPKLVYNNTKYQFPYITQNFTMECGKTNDNKLFLRICPIIRNTDVTVTGIYNNNQYLLIQKEMTWQDAELYCENIGGHLAVIRDEGTYTYIKSLIQQSSNVDFWIGGSDVELEGTWKWVTGETFYQDGLTTNGYYTNWNSGEPSNSGTDITENYLEIAHINGAFGWNDLDGTKPSYFICEIESYRADTEIPIELVAGKIVYDIYAKRNTIPYLI